MHLAAQNVKRFYDIWFALLYYVNQHRQIVPSFSPNMEPCLS